jgi:cytochrome P450
MFHKDIGSSSDHETYAGKNFFIWFGPTPRVYIMDPEQIKDVFTNIGEFQKPHTNPLSKLLSLGVVTYEGEKWVKHRKIINPAFRIEKLKVISFTFCFCLNPFTIITCV